MAKKAIEVLRRERDMPDLHRMASSSRMEGVRTALALIAGGAMLMVTLPFSLVAAGAVALARAAGIHREDIVHHA